MTESIVILGAGIIGTSTAYYLSLTQNPSSIHLVESSPRFFASASGYAGGFLAADWFSPSVAALGRLSFEEHRHLAEQFSGKEKWGYARSTSVGYAPGRRSAKDSRGDDWLRQGASRGDIAVGGGVDGRFAEDWEPRWLMRSEGDDMELISQEGSTAQVDPFRLSQFLLQSCKDRGVQLHHPAKAIRIGKDMQDEISSIRILDTETNAETDIPCTKILIAAGAWSPQVFSILFPSSGFKLPIQSLAGHSLVVRTPRWETADEEKGCHAIFTTDEAGYSPEVFSRLGSEIYIAGFNSDAIPLPALATGSEIKDDAIKVLERTSRRLLGIDSKDRLETVRRGLCFRPVTEKGSPILTRIPDQKLGVALSTRGGGEGGVFLAAGHGPWGITLSLGTGKVMGEMIQGRALSADISGLSF